MRAADEDEYSIDMEENIGGQSVVEFDGFCKSVEFNSTSNSSLGKESKRSTVLISKESKLTISQQKDMSQRLNSSSKVKKMILLKQSTEKVQDSNKEHKLNIAVEESKNETKGSQRLISAC